MENIYEEYYPEKISYDAYESAMQEKDQEISSLQDEIYKQDIKIEELENEIKRLKSEKNI